jgi:hypothetical protein
LTSLGFETIQFASKFTGQRADLFQLVELGKSAGFDWVSFDLLGP